MLSRVAESLYWTGRYIERAEDTSRLLHVNFHGLLDADLPDRGRTWQELILMLGRDDVYREHFDDYTAPAVSEFMLWHPANPDAVTACVARARENARGVREQISSEMWELLNKLHLLVSRTRPAAVLASPHAFFVRIREASHAFQGVMKATLPRGEAYEFLELGAHFERADTTARLLAIKVPSLRLDEPESVTNESLSSLLKSCGAFEAFRKQGIDELRAARVVAFLLLERRLPRAVSFCLEQSLSSIRAISGDGPAARTGDRPRLRRALVHGPAGAGRGHRAAAAARHPRPRGRGRRDRRRLLHDARHPARPLRPATAAAIAMFLRVEHTTEFTYDGPIAEAYTELRLRPLEGGGQHCSSFRLATEPPGLRVREYRDHFGNDVHHFDVLEPHERLSVTAVSTVMTPATFMSGRDVPTPLELHDYLGPTSYVPFSASVGEFAASHAASTSAPARARELMDAVRDELIYEPGATDVQTRADEVLALGRGVCQDFAHVLLGACRSVGIPARYVSGYLYDPTLAGRQRGLARLDRRLGRGRRLVRARPDARARADRGVRPRRRRQGLRRRAADPRRLHGLRQRNALGPGRPARALTRNAAAWPATRRRSARTSLPATRSPTWPTSRTRASGIPA